MSQPTYSSAAGYISEQFFTIAFDVSLDAVNPPSLSAFAVQINGTDATISAVEVNSTDKSIKITFASQTLLAGDIIDFAYTDPTAGNDPNAIQGLDGSDSASFSQSIVVVITRPGPSAPSVPALDNASDSGTLGDHITSDNTPTVSGTSEANATVKLYDTDGSTLLGTTTADGSGNWSITSSQLTDGSHTLKATQTNNLSQTSALSNGLALNIDSVANAPTTIAVAAGSDSGTLGDGISNVGTPVITGVSEANATVLLYDTDGSTPLGSAKADGSGKWSITSSNLVTGAHTLTAKQTDAAGNVSSASSGFSYTVDTIGPVGMALSSNSVQMANATNGATVATLSSTDITSVTYGFAVGNGTIDADNGKFSISGTSLTAAQNLSAGAYHIYLKATDAAGNDAYQIFTLNVTNAPSINSIVRAGSASATVLASDTSINYTVTFSESVTGVDISDFTLTPSSSASGTIASVSGSGSTYTVTVDTLGGDGSLRLDLNASGTGIKNGGSVDLGGNGYTSGETYTLDHTAPNATSTPAMTAGTDSGSSSSDAITSNTTPVFTGTGEANATVKLYDTDGTTVLGTTTADGSGKWSITSSTLSSGAHSVSVKQSDAAGNVSSASSTLAVMIDTSAPSAPAAPLLSPGSDSGTSGDFLTNVNTPIITGTAEANAIVKLYDTDGSTLLGTTTADGSGKWSVTSSSLGDGSHTLTVKQTDLAGNVSGASSALNLDIDTSIPNAPSTPALQTASDSGTLSDGITKIVTPTLIGTGTVGDTVTLYDTDGSTVLGTAVVDGSGNWSIASSTLSDGLHTVTVKQTNAAGTTSSASTGFGLTIDATAPSAPATPNLASGSDSGTLGDGITKFNTPVITGTSEANATVKLYDTDGTTLLGSTTADGSGKWSITSSTLADGSHTVTVKQTDVAGNVSLASSGLVLSIDTSTPSAPAAPLLSPGSDSGTSGDFLTNVTTPIITGTAEANAIVKLYDTDGSTLLGTTTADGSGKWSVTSSSLGDGSHTLTVKQTDLAGNASVASSSLSINIDTSVPNPPSVPALQTASDSGTLSDGITKIVAPTLIGTGTVGNSVTLYDTDGSTVLGTAVVDGSGNWSIASSTLSNGVHSITVKQSNPAGTTSKASSVFSLTIDNIAPDAPSSATLMAASDSNILGDNVTNVTTPTVSGTADANALMTLYDSDGSTVLGTASADGSGKWSITSSKLSSGIHALQVKQSDAAGNQSGAANSLVLTVDSDAPTDLSLSASQVDATAGSNAVVGKLSSTDAVSSSGFSYALVAGSGANDNALFTIVDGVLHIINPASATPGLHSIRVSSTDLAGNTLEKILSITVQANQLPVVGGLSNTTQTITAGVPFTLEQLTISDPDSNDLSVTLTLVNGSLNNISDADPNTAGIQLKGTPAQITAALAQASFTALAVGAASLGISVTDHANPNAVSASYQFTVQAPPLVDGVPVLTMPITLPGGNKGSSVSIEPVTSTRVDDTGTSTLADIPLVTENNSAILSAHVPLGFGLKAIGGSSQTVGNSLEHLVAAIIASTPNNLPADQAHLTGNGQNFLSLLPSSVPLLVETIKPSVGSSTPTQALQLTGNANSTEHTALVIDASELPSGNSVSLRHVDFAAVIGNLSVNGNTNGQVLTGDAASQHFTVHNNGISQVFSGAGSDTLQFGTNLGIQSQLTVQTLATADASSVLHGGSGLDNAVFTQAAAAYKVEQHDGYTLVTSIAEPNQAVRLVNVETLKFADQSIAVTHRAELNTVAGLYTAILGRQADVGGFDYWGGLQTSQVALGEIALNMMNTAEGRSKGYTFTGQAAHDVEQLYLGLFNRQSDAGGLQFWANLIENGTLTLVGVANAFISAPEMEGHKLAVTGWDFLL